MGQYFVYILSNKNRTVLYIGYTSNIERRMKELINGTGAFFTKKHNATELVYLETFKEMKIAKQKERQLKNWQKEWKWILIKMSNPNLESIIIN